MKHKFSLLVMLAVFLMAGANVGVSFAATQNVTTAADDGDGSLRAAIAAAVAGDEITFNTSLAGATITLERAIIIDKSLTIKGSGQKLTPRSNGIRALEVKGGLTVTIERLQFDGFDIPNGAAIKAEEDNTTLTVASSIFSNCTANDFGGAIQIWKGGFNLNVYGCTFYNNNGRQGGAITFVNSGDLKVVGSVFYDNYLGLGEDQGWSANGNNISGNNNMTSGGYNAFENTSCASFSYAASDLQNITDNPLDADYVPTTDAIKILPATLPADYPTLDFYGNAIEGEGFAGAVQSASTLPPPAEAYDRQLWTAQYSSGANGAYGRPNTPTIMLDGNFKNEAQGWHSIESALGFDWATKRIRESFAVDVKETLDLSSVSLYTTGDIGDIEIYLSDEAPTLVRATDDADPSWGSVVATWTNPYADDVALNAAKQTYGTGEGAENALKIDIDLPAGSEGRYVIVAYLSTQVRGDGRYVNNTEFEAYGTSEQEGKITISPKSSTVYTNDYGQLAVQVASELEGETVTWTSSDETTATVVDGKVIGLKVGKVTITAEAGGYSGTANVTVTSNTRKPNVLLGKYTVLPESYRIDNGGAITADEFAGNNVVTIDAAADQPETGFAFTISDIWGGYYEFGRGYGSAYRTLGTFVQNDDEITFTDYVRAGWDTEWDKENSTAEYEYVITEDANDSTKLNLTLIWGDYTFYLFLVKELAVPQEEPLAGMYYIGKDNPLDVIAVLSEDSTTLTISGTGLIKNFLISYSDPYVGGGAPWVVDLVLNDEGGIVSATRVPAADKITSIIIEEGVTYLGNALAWGVAKIENISLPSTLDSIGSRAFSAQSLKIDTLKIPDNVKKVASYAFEGSSSSEVKVITLPAGIETFGVHSFDISGIEAIYISAETPPVLPNETTFNRVSKTTCILYVPAGKVEDYKAADVWKDFVNIREIGDEIPFVELPYTLENGTFADDIVPFLTGSSADKNNDGVVAIAFTVEKSGKLTATAADYTVYLFDSPSADGSEIVKGTGGFANQQIEAGTYYLVIDNESAATTTYSLSVTFDPDGINSTGKAVKSVIYYDLLGRTVTRDAKGIVIKRITYDDGSVETKKVYVLPNK
ncbi:MAG: DUF5012 domain-containing protein [Dysgonamonadaceae bacterium]|jgi:hypothetical protein|nr:DUF5012 domain-containing protein [Dysgonamonadaceae bacterium]